MAAKKDAPLISRSISVAILLSGALLSGGGIGEAFAQSDPTAAMAAPGGGTPRPARRSHRRQPKPSNVAAKPAAPAPEPWQVVDPGRAANGCIVPPDEGGAPVPNVHHVVRPDEDRVSYGVKWNSSNAPNAGAYSTQGVVDEINHDLGAPSAVGTSAEAGVGLKF